MFQCYLLFRGCRKGWNMATEEDKAERVWRNDKGFSLIELMIVVAIILLLSGIAVSPTRPYIEKGWKAEMMVFAGEYRKDVQAFFDQTGRLPKDNAQAGLPSAERITGHHVTRLDVVNGEIHVQSDHPRIRGLRLIPRPRHQQLLWTTRWEYRKAGAS